MSLRHASPLVFSRLPLLLASTSLLIGACRNKSKPIAGGRPAGSSVASTVAASTAPGLFSCSDVGHAPSLVVGERRPAPKPLDGEQEPEDDVDLPFAVELGSARANASFFAIGGVESRRGASFAFAAVVPTSGAVGHRIDLGRVFGEVEPPALAPSRDGWIALVADNDAAALVLKIVGASPPFDAATLRHGGEITGVRRDAAEFAIETSADQALAAWTRLEKGRGSVELARIRTDTLALDGAPFAAPAALGGEPESPELARRPNGYYLAWIARGAATPPKHVPARRDEDDVDAGAPPNLLDEGPTAIEVVPLDVRGNATAAPRRITPPSSRVVAFDMTPTPDGGLLVVYRDERDGPGLERDSAEAVLVHPDGTTTARSWQTGDSAGLPSLLADAAPGKDQAWAWVSVASERELGLAALASDPLGFTGLASDPHLAGTEALAASAGKLLLSRAHAGQRELSVVQCRGSVSPVPAGSAAPLDPDNPG